MYQFHQNRLASPYDGRSRLQRQTHKQMGWSREYNLYLMKQNKKLSMMTKKVINRGKRSETMSEVKLVKNIRKNP